VKRRVYIILASLIFIHCRYSAAINESVKIENYSYKEGLMASGVNSVYKDSKGFLWMCTNNGLFRYDGYIFKNINSIANGYLKYETYCIIEDEHQNFWIGTAGRGVFYYNTHTGKLFPLKLSEGGNSKVNRILFYQKKIWFATNTGLIVVDEKENIDENTYIEARVLLPDSLHRNLQTNLINFVYAQPGSKSLWVGTNSILCELNPDTYQFKFINSNNQNSIRWLSDYFNNNIIASSWDGGVFVVNPRKKGLENDTFINEINKIVGNKRVKSAIIDKQKRCWVATYGEGLYIFKKEKNGKISYENYRNEETLPNKLKSNFIDQIFNDNTGITWISMSESGLSKMYFQQSKFRYYNFYEPKNQNRPKEILAIKQSSDKNKFWITFNRNEIDLFDTRDIAHKQYTGNSSGLQLQNDKVLLTYQDKKGNLWIVYSRIGLYVVPAKDAIPLVNENTISTIRPLNANNIFSNDPRANSYITCFFEDSKGRLWIGNWGSTYILELMNDFQSSKSSNNLRTNAKVTLVYSEEQREKLNFTISPVNSIIEAEKNTFWLGTRDGGIIVMKETSNLKFDGKDLDLNGELPSNNVKCFHLDKDRKLWIGTNSGLCYLDKNNSEIKRIKNGLTLESISNIAEDDSQNMWISTSYGIYKIKHKDFSVINLFNSDKEKLNQYIHNAVSVTPLGDIWFSTNESLVRFNPDSIEVNQIPAPLYFTDIKINNHTITPLEKYRGVHIIDNELNASKTINVPYGSALNIEFAALEYLDPERILYKYKIGNDSEWIQLNPKQRSIILPNMNSGEYNLSIQVANSSDKKESRSIKINYLPPFWFSKMAYVIYFLIVLLLLITYRRLIIQKIVQKSLVEKERYERRKIEELDKMKSEFFSNISHEFRTPLSLIINPLEKLVNHEDISDKNKNKIGLVLRSSYRLLKLTNELMDFSKIEKDLLKPDFQLCEIVSMTNEISLLFNNLADSMNIEFKINQSFDQLEIPLDKGMVEKVIFNLLSNAFKYTSINGIIMVNLSKSSETEKEYVKISVINTGEGISKENLGRIFDRYYQVNNVQNKNVAGTGIGLALVKSFVELHKGKVEVKSEPNLETCFDIYLPIIQEGFNSIGKLYVINTKKAYKYSGVIQDNKSLSDKPTFHYRVLVIEDEEDIRNYIIDELSTDYKVLSATNGEEGITIANETIPDLIITDVMIPLITGIELCNKLKNQVITSHIPIIILSAKTNIKEQIEGLEMGADVYMIKPFNIDYLKAQILRLINFKQAIYSRYLKETNLFPQEIMPNKLDEEFMRKVLTFIEENLTNSDLNVDQLANYISLSKVQTYRKVKAISGLSIVEFIRTVRLKKAAQLVLECHLNFSEIAFETGFSTPSYFSKCFHDHFGKTPSEYAMEYGEKKEGV
jgi:signal transduction histidine kinase/ligand-binding sensor domain-containing protein/DNA-binding response OmpR family regulator